jgi:uroporphyrinogen III methyltransferase/synthase
MSGRVALVGAGPGDPKLLTLRAAELVAHDELVSEAILAMAPLSAEVLPVGRRVGHGPPTYRLHPDVLARARAGRFVVRLKAGDPLVFGRGGEEAEELAAAGIPFEIVPGITAALGAAASACIPLTHRDYAAQALLMTAHHGDGGMPGAVAGRTLVLYMASRKLAANLRAIAAAGWPRSTPAALVLAATTAREQTVTGTLSTLAERAKDVLAASPDLPGIVFIGDVVRVREALGALGARGTSATAHSEVSRSARRGS